jgi:hypothetical protein
MQPSFQKQSDDEQPSDDLGMLVRSVPLRQPTGPLFAGAVGSPLPGAARSLGLARQRQFAAWPGTSLVGSMDRTIHNRQVVL